MAKIYCPHCGFKNEYNLDKPEKCSSCGEPFINSFNKLKIKPSEILNKKVNASIKKEKEMIDSNLDEFDEDDSDINYVPDINGLQYEINYAENGNKIYNGRDFFNISEEDEKKIISNKNISSRERRKKTNISRKKRDN